jgi:predicted O-methyltransferase YrrM
VAEYPIPGLADVPEFLTPGAAWLLDGLARHQTEAGVGGDIAEIGVFYGRSSLVMGRALAPGERLTACDRFDVTWQDVPGWTFPPSGPPEEALRRRWSEWVGGDGLRILRADSADLAPGDLGEGLRLVHVDGGHDYDDVRRDLALAEAALAPAGALVADDVLLPEWPDVTVALIDHLRAPGTALVPVLVAEHKTVLCRPEHAPRYGRWARAAAPAAYPSPGFLLAERGFAGHAVLVVSRMPA